MIHNLSNLILLEGDVRIGALPGSLVVMVAGRRDARLNLGHSKLVSPERRFPARPRHRLAKQLEF